MIITEYRVLVPLEVEEFKRGQLFSISEASKNETGGGEGVEILEQKDFSSSNIRKGHDLNGVYTHKLYHLKSKMPWLVRKILPESAMVFDEECWNAYPYCKTVITNPGYMEKDFYVIIETIHLQDSGDTENALNASKETLKQREVVVLDVYDDVHLNKKTDYFPDTDPRLFKSVKTGRGLLEANWSKTTEPVMCCYKLVTAYFKWTGFQGKVERMIQGGYPRLFTKFHREVFCWIDKWYHLSMEDIRKYEEETAEKLRNQLQHGRIRGMCSDATIIVEDKEN